MTKAVNWAAIKKRYLQGEKPKAIAADFGLTAKQVSDKAHAEKWVRKKSEILEKIPDLVLSDLEETIALYGGLIKDTARQVLEARKAGLLGLTVQDGEGFVNKFAENEHKAGLAIYMERLKHTHRMQLAEATKQAPEEGEIPGFNVSPDA